MLRIGQIQNCIQRTPRTAWSFIAKSSATVTRSHATHGKKALSESLASHRHSAAGLTRHFFATEALLTVEDSAIVREVAKSSRKAPSRAATKDVDTVPPKTRKPIASSSLKKSTLKGESTETAEMPPKKPRRTKASQAAQEEALKTLEKQGKDISTPKKTRTKKTKPENLSTSVPDAVKTELRDYQKECIETCLANLKEGTMRQIVSLPVGSGKTVIFSHLMKQVPSPFPGATKTLILAHRQELLEQTRNHVLRNGTGLTVTIDQGKRLADMSADVIVASVPSLGRVGTPRLLQYNPREFKCIIIDEAHHAAADSYGRILKHFGADVPNTHIFVYGCSATVRRHDGLRLSGVFDHISFHKGFITMIEDKWLCGLRVSTIQTDFDLKDVKMQGGDFAQKDLAVKVNTEIRNDIVVRSYMTYCAARKSTVVFAVDIAHLETLTEVFRKYGYDARGLSSKTSDVERAQLLEDFRDRKFPIIVNCGILTEGTDIPVIDSIVMARPTKSNVLFQQMLGRGMRLHPDKTDCLVLDFVDVVRGDGLVNLPTLLGLDPSAVMRKDLTINSQADVEAILEEQIKSLGVDPPPSFSEDQEVEEVVDPMTGVKVARIRVLEYENPYQLIGDCSGTSRRVWEMSSNAWVNVAPDTFVLTFKAITFKIEKSSSDGLWRCQKRVTLDSNKPVAEASVKSYKNGVLTFSNNYVEARKRKQEEEQQQKSGHVKSKGTMLPIEADTLQDCLHGVDTWIAKKIGHFPEILGRFAKWRKSPASDSQLRFLRKLGYDHDALSEEAEVGNDPEKWRERNLRQLNKGQAANMITRLVHGAGKRWEESKKFKVKRAKALAKEIGVDVGPIPKYVEV
ncbi:hypothetical protein CPB97_001245 [Podila verticillata]|nr:hypothetical protein CPB97_001245 [Podila verticillata]